MAAAGIRPACWCLSRWRLNFSALPPVASCCCSLVLDLLSPLATFLWSLEWGGLTIALVGIGRERWLAARRR